MQIDCADDVRAERKSRPGHRSSGGSYSVDARESLTNTVTGVWMLARFGAFTALLLGKQEDD